MDPSQPKAHQLTPLASTAMSEIRTLARIFCNMGSIASTASTPSAMSEIRPLADLRPFRSKDIATTNEIQVDSGEFFTGPDAGKWASAKVGLLHGGNNQTPVDVVLLTDIYGSGRTIVACMFRESPKSYETDSYAWVRIQDGSTQMALVPLDLISEIKER